MLNFVVNVFKHNKTSFDINAVLLFQTGIYLKDEAVVLVSFLLKILSRANSLIANNNIRGVILEIKMTDVTSLKY